MGGYDEKQCGEEWWLARTLEVFRFGGSKVDKSRRSDQHKRKLDCPCET